jgi:prepilin-type N-terminal cleavage/methylation domain-containing protein
MGCGTTGLMNIPSVMAREKTRYRLGYTLTELIIVLAIIVAILSFAWPVVRGPAGRESLRYAAKYLRGELAEARLQAIRTGYPWEFRFEPGGNRYVIISRAKSEVSSGWPAGGLDDPTSTAMASPVEKDTGIEETGGSFGPRAFSVGELPDGVVFRPLAGSFVAPSLAQEVEVGTGSFDVSLLGAQALELGDNGISGSESVGPLAPEAFQLPRGLEFAENWESIVFFPSGRIARNRCIFLQDMKGNNLPVLVRAVTGTSVIGEPGPGTQQATLSQGPSSWSASGE